MKDSSIYINVTGKFFQGESIKFKGAGKNIKREAIISEVKKMKSTIIKSTKISKSYGVMTK